MPLSKHHVDIQVRATPFDVARLAAALQAKCGEIDFAFLMGSAVSGIVAPHSDLDIAVWLNVKSSIDIYTKIGRICDEHVPDVRCDLGILNSADPIYRFEALQGKLLFTRSREKYLRFYSLTCREYESQLADYERQHRYRMSA